MSRTAWLALLLAASHLLTVIVTCPSSQRTPLDAAAGGPVGPVSHSLPDAKGGEMHAHHDAEHSGDEDLPPCHAPASSLKAPCPCGCEGGVPVARSGLFGVGEMILADEGPPFDEGAPVQTSAAPLLLGSANPSEIDHIPIFA